METSQILPLRVQPQALLGSQSGVDWKDRRFLKLISDLRLHGGMLPIEEVRSIRYVSNPEMLLREELVRREFFALKWRLRLWVPIFQFHLPGWEISRNAAKVAGLLHPFLQGFELAEWFTTANPWLEDNSPVKLLETQTENVLKAAMADRNDLAAWFAVDE